MAANGFLRAAYSELLGGNYFTVELHRKVHERQYDRTVYLLRMYG